MIISICSIEKESVVYFLNFEKRNPTMPMARKLVIAIMRARTVCIDYQYSRTQGEKQNEYTLSPNSWKQSVMLEGNVSSGTVGSAPTSVCQRKI